MVPITALGLSVDVVATKELQCADVALTLLFFLSLRFSSAQGSPSSSQLPDFFGYLSQSEERPKWQIVSFEVSTPGPTGDRFSNKALLPQVYPL
jgi:hypothetical protein